MQNAELLANWLSSATSVVAFSGAGISTESGIPDFRSPQGIWSKASPVYFDDFLRSPTARHEYWRQKSIAHVDFASAQPNDGHRVLADWESAGLLGGVITQNIDGLHQMAGSRRVLELHGTAREIGCLNCGKRFPADPWVRTFLESQTVPDCPDCGGLLKHATISFGQALNETVLEDALRMARECDVFLAIGSSLVVHPAAGLPALAKDHGARLVIINRDATPLDGLADLVIHEAIGITLKQAAEAASNAKRRG
jgi:NAD-dependent protein deacetylase/lipoamidase